MASKHSVAIFWDYENCSLPTKSVARRVVHRITDLAHEYGDVVSFKAYSGFQVPEKHRPDLHCSGVTMIDCPHNGCKDVVDNTLIVDMLAFAIDCPSPATVILIAGDSDYVYALSVLRLRRYRVIVIAPRSMHSSLLAQASAHMDWNDDVLDKDGSESVGLPMFEGKENETIDRSSLGSPPSGSNSKGKGAVFKCAAGGPSGSASLGMQAGSSVSAQVAVATIRIDPFLPRLSPEPGPESTPLEPLALPAQELGVPLINSDSSECDGPAGAHGASSPILTAVVDEPRSFPTHAISAATGLPPSATFEEPSEVSTHGEAANPAPSASGSPSHAQSNNPGIATSAVPRSVAALSEECSSRTHTTVTAGPTESPNIALKDFSHGRATAQLSGVAVSPSSHDMNAAANANVQSTAASIASQGTATTTTASGSSLPQTPVISVAPREPFKAKPSFLESCRNTWNSLRPLAVTWPLPTANSSLPVVTPSARTECSLVTATSGMTSPRNESARLSFLPFLNGHGVSGPCPPEPKEDDQPCVIQTSQSDGVAPNRDPDQIHASSTSRSSPTTVPDAAVVNLLPLAQATPAMSSADSRQAETVQSSCSTSHEHLLSSTPALPSANASGAHPALASVAGMPEISDASSPCNIPAFQSADASLRPNPTMATPATASSGASILASSSAGASGSVPVATSNAAAANDRNAQATLFRGLLLELRRRNITEGCTYVELAQAVATKDPTIYRRLGITGGKNRPLQLFDRAAAAGILTLVPCANGVRTAGRIRLTEEWRS